MATSNIYIELASKVFGVSEEKVTEEMVRTAKIICFPKYDFEKK